MQHDPAAHAHAVNAAVGSTGPNVDIDPGRLVPTRPPIQWWCYRLEPVSGRYSGDATSGTSKYRIDLRVDIDVRHANSPVLDVVSADVHQKYEFRWGGTTYNWSVYRYSWVIENPTVTWQNCNVNITGSLRMFPPPGQFWLAQNATIDIGWTYGRISSATVNISSKPQKGTTYNCSKQSDAFRDLALEVDYCASVDTAPTLPSYNTTWHSTRPGNIDERVLTIEEAYLEAGIEVTIDPNHTVIDDSAAGFSSWSPAELHDAMETYYSKHSGSWPKWQQWCLLAGSFDSSGVGGIMFDAASGYGGSGDAPERQGSAIFKNHSWWNNLVDGAPSNDTEAAAMRKFLHTYVHEMGHAFNHVHSWDKSRPDALSYMNYDWKYENRNGANSYWNNFQFQFDDDELMHLRHADRKAIIPGGDPWASGLHSSDPESGSEAGMITTGDAPLELLVRPKEFYDFMEPVVIEARLRNLSDIPLTVDARLEPEHGTVAYFIQTPAGHTATYHPAMSLFGDAEYETLGATTGGEGPDRRSRTVKLSFGADGHYFAEPGEYKLRAIYHESGGMVVTSNVATLRVGRPYSREEEAMATKVFDHKTGLAWYLGGSRSDHLKEGRETLIEVCERFPDGKAAAEIAAVLAADLTKPFYTVNDKNKLVVSGKASPAQAVKFADQALDAHAANPDVLSNLTIAQVGQAKAEALAGSRKKADATKTMRSVTKKLKDGGVHESVLADLKAFSEAL